jgi:hypothetical protein
MINTTLSTFSDGGRSANCQLRLGPIVAPLNSNRSLLPSNFLETWQVNRIRRIDLSWLYAKCLQSCVVILWPRPLTSSLERYYRVENSDMLYNTAVHISLCRKISLRPEFPQQHPLEKFIVAGHLAS